MRLFLNKSYDGNRSAKLTPVYITGPRRPTPESARLHTMILDPIDPVRAYESVPTRGKLMASFAKHSNDHFSFEAPSTTILSLVGSIPSNHANSNIYLLTSTDEGVDFQMVFVPSETTLGKKLEYSFKTRGPFLLYDYHLVNPIFDRPVFRQPDPTVSTIQESVTPLVHPIPRLICRYGLACEYANLGGCPFTHSAI
jgi:hypothetical protein